MTAIVPVNKFREESDAPLTAFTDSFTVVVESSEDNFIFLVKKPISRTQIRSTVIWP